MTLIIKKNWKMQFLWGVSGLKWLLSIKSDSMKERWCTSDRELWEEGKPAEVVCSFGQCSATLGPVRATLKHPTYLSTVAVHPLKENTPMNTLYWKWHPLMAVASFIRIMHPAMNQKCSKRVWRFVQLTICGMFRTNKSISHHIILTSYCQMTQHTFRELVETCLDGSGV